jgi:hypothetical protein
LQWCYDEQGVDLRSKHSYLAAYLLQEKHKGTKSFWSPYMRILPQKYANMPCYFDEELLSWLKGSMTMQKIADRIDSLRREYDNIRRVSYYLFVTLDHIIHIHFHNSVNIFRTICHEVESSMK